MPPGMLEKLGEGGMRGKLGAKKWQWRLVSLNEETLAWYAETSAGGGAGGTAEDAMTEMVRLCHPISLLCSLRLILT